jgi:hypothetical protein
MMVETLQARGNGVRMTVDTSPAIRDHTFVSYRRDDG